jgi:hypothetical protein
MMKSKFYLVGGNGEIVQNKVLPDVTDDEIEKLYKIMIKDDPDHAKFKGSKREYVQEVYDRMKVFLTYQDAFFNEKKKRKMKGGMMAYVEEEDVKEPEGELKESKEPDLEKTMREEIIPTMDYEEIFGTVPDLYKIILNSTVLGNRTVEKVTKNVRDIIKKEKPKYTDILHVKQKFNLFAESFLDAFEGKTLPELLKIQKNILNLTLYPYISDWEHYGGLGTYQLRIFIGKAEDQDYVTKLQGKYGEYLERSDTVRMEENGFINDRYIEGEFLLRSGDLLDSDIFDLQEIKKKQIKHIGEVKCFFMGRPLKLQATKLTIMVKIYDWITNPVAGAGASELKIGKYEFVRANFTDAKNIPVVLYYVDKEKSRTKTELPTRHVIPVRIEFNGFKIVEYLKKNNTIVYESMKNVDLNEHFMINDSKRIVTKKTLNFEGYKKEYDFNVEELKTAVKSITDTKTNKSMSINTKFTKTKTKTKDEEFPEFSKIPSTDFIYYNEHKPSDTSKFGSTKPTILTNLLEWNKNSKNVDKAYEKLGKEGGAEGTKKTAQTYRKLLRVPGNIKTLLNTNINKDKPASNAVKEKFKNYMSYVSEKADESKLKDLVTAKASKDRSIEDIQTEVGEELSSLLTRLNKFTHYINESDFNYTEIKQAIDKEFPDENPLENELEQLKIERNRISVKITRLLGKINESKLKNEPSTPADIQRDIQHKKLYIERKAIMKKIKEIENKLKSKDTDSTIEL